MFIAVMILCKLVQAGEIFNLTKTLLVKMLSSYRSPKAGMKMKILYKEDGKP